MKKLLLVMTMMLAMISCQKQAEQPSAPQVMNGVEFTAKYHIILPFLDYGNDGTANRTTARKVKATEATLTVTEDLFISGSVVCSVSSNAQWGGIQRFESIPLTMDGATSPCNYYWSRTGTDFPVPMVCPVAAPGVYRGFTSDGASTSTAYDVHLSQLLSL